jgi:hypothetical protein
MINGISNSFNHFKERVHHITTQLRCRKILVVKMSHSILKGIERYREMQIFIAFD